MSGIPSECPHCGSALVNPFTRPIAVRFPDRRMAGGRRVSRTVKTGAHRGETLVEWEYLMVADCIGCGSPIYDAPGAGAWPEEGAEA